MSDTAENASGSSDIVNKARDTLSSIYSFYAANRETLDRIPFFISQSSREIPMMLRSSTVPSAEQTEEMKKQLQGLLQTKEAIENIPARERQMMVEAAYASTVGRKGAQ
ncbi:hypothetical protein J3458_020559 [Metarhizium acridum]|uniref:uncharacterized protein n=1 Tax=Metarhizium acridum TaxID=92637 RepID=UPI001C6B1ED6|nr:hypothetical protein J3458_020559 [Metarhizium acridum]